MISIPIVASSTSTTLNAFARWHGIVSKYVNSKFIINLNSSRVELSRAEQIIVQRRSSCTWMRMSLNKYDIYFANAHQIIGAMAFRLQTDPNLHYKSLIAMEMF